MRNAALSAAIVLSCLTGSLPSRAWATSNFSFVLLTDTHVTDGDTNFQFYLHQAVDDINAMNPLPKVAIFTGDLTDHGTNTEFDGLMTEINRLNPAIMRAPVPGNHDLKAQTLSQGYRVKVKNELDYSFNIQGVHFIGISDVPDGVADADDNSPTIAGHLTTAQLNWIHSDLQGAASRDADWTIMYSHHPLWDSNAEYGLYGLKNDDYFGNVNNANTLMTGWMDEFDVGMYTMGHRHYEALPIHHAFADGSWTEHVLNEATGRSFTPGYQVYEVRDGRIDSYRKNLLNSSGVPYNGASLTERPFTIFTPRPIPEPSAVGLMLISSLMAVSARRRRVTPQARGG